MTENQLIARLAQIFGAPPPGVALGIGDDAAVLDPTKEPLCWSIDAAVERVHFERAWLDGELIGHRATVTALSDLAAMGARPLGVLASLVLPADSDEALVAAIATGQARACRELGTAVIGGNLSRGGELSITTAVLGAATNPMRRDAARPGDALWLAGEVGLAGAGLLALHRGRSHEAGLSPAVTAWREPRALIELGVEAAAVARAAIDVSDGLALDAARLAEASRLAVVLEEPALVSAELRAAAGLLATDALELALHGGEDYALLVAAPAGGRLPHGFRRVGRCREAAPAEQRAEQRAEERAEPPRVWLETGRGVEPVVARGYDHFAAHR